MSSPFDARLKALVLAGALVLVGAAPPVASAAQVTLRLWPAGQGRIDVVQNGTPIDSCHFSTILDTENPCSVEVTSGVPVTLTAVPDLLASPPPSIFPPDFPVPSPSFVRWSVFDCPGTGPCTFVPDADLDWVTALFTPLQLEVGIAGAGHINGLACDSTGFGDSDCHGLRAADSNVELVATPDNPLDPIRWGPGCEPAGGNPSSASCTVAMTNIRTFAAVAFGDPSVVVPPDFPFQITPRLRVDRGGTGQGRVTGSGIDCGSVCSADDLVYQSRVTLTASSAPGSTFVRWVGVCSTNPTCVFSAGSVSRVQARFDAAAASSSSTTPTTKVPGGGRSRVLTARLVRASMRGHGRRRVVAMVVVVNRAGRARVRLLKRRRTVASRRFNLVKGRNSLRLRVPRSAKAGRYRLSVKIVAGGATRTLSAAVTIRR
jgi:Divergent InlB B-repeat domain